MPKSRRLGRLLWNAVLHRNCTRPPSLGFKFFNYFALVAGLLPFLWRHIRTVFIEDFLFIRNYVATLTHGYSQCPCLLSSLVIVSGKMEISAFVMGPVGSLPGCVYICVCACGRWGMVDGVCWVRHKNSIMPGWMSQHITTWLAIFHNLVVISFNKCNKFVKRQKSTICEVQVSRTRVNYTHSELVLCADCYYKCKQSLPLLSTCHCQEFGCRQQPTLSIVNVHIVWRFKKITWLMVVRWAGWLVVGR